MSTGRKQRTFKSIAILVRIIPVFDEGQVEHRIVRISGNFEIDIQKWW